MARTRAIGLRREPQPPMPIVMPEPSWPTISSAVITLPVMTVPVTRPPSASSGPVHERLARLVGDTGQVELEGETLLVPVRAPDVDRVDAVQRLLGQRDDGRVLGGDL